jgi:hypothetical protein
MIMPQDSWKRGTLARTIFGCMLGTALLVVANAARAGESDDPEDNMPDTQIIRGVLKGLGLRHDGDAIEYRERSPLVVPQTRDLPVPESDASAKPNDPNWPVDAEVKRRKAAAAAQKKVSTADVTERSRPLRPNEITTTGVDPKGGGQQQESTGSVDPSANGGTMSPSQLGFSGFSFGSLFASKPDTATFTTEPSRSSLTEPPEGYRTPSPNQPYGVSKDKQAGPGQAYDFFTKHGEAPAN